MRPTSEQQLRRTHGASGNDDTTGARCDVDDARLSSPGFALQLNTSDVSLCSYNSSSVSVRPQRELVGAGGGCLQVGPQGTLSLRMINEKCGMTIGEVLLARVIVWLIKEFESGSI